MLTNTVANFNAAQPMTIAADPSISPRDYSENPPKNYNALMNPKPADLMTTGCGLAPLADAPVFCDSAYGGDALPILYYRMDVKYDASIVPVMPKTATQFTAGSPPASFYCASNDYIANQGGGSAGSKAFQSSSINHLQSTASASGNIPDGPTVLQNMTFQTSSTISSVRAPYVPHLSVVRRPASSGPDLKGNVDDIIVSGGL